MTNRKTQRKNKTNLVMKWPSNDDYFVISPGHDGSMVNKALMTINSNFVEITLRVRLKKAIEGDGCPKSVQEIGSKNTGYGRPIKAFVMLPVNPLALEKAKTDGVLLDSQMVSIIEVNGPLTVVAPNSPPITNITTPTTPIMA